MKKIIRFSRLFLLFSVVSLLIILSGVYRIATQGINFGLDFAPGLLIEARIAAPAFSLTYSGSARAVVQTNSTGLSIIVSGAGAENATYNYAYADYAKSDLGALTAAIGTLDGITVQRKAPASAPVSTFFIDSSVSTVLSPSVPFVFHVSDSSKVITADEVRDALIPAGNAQVKQLGAPGENAFQVRIPDTGAESNNQDLQDTVLSVLRAAYGADSVAVIKTDFIGAQFSHSLALKSIIMVLLTLVLIWVYSTIRFQWDFALGAVIAIAHDALIMLTFIAWTQIEFSTVILASILTIIGYSINDTIVVLDRVRENVKILKVQKFIDHLDTAQTEILSRTIITTVTTLLAVASLFVFTTGTMKDFALCLIIGMISGVYSTIFITGGFISFTRKNWKPADQSGKIALHELRTPIKT
jgi:preprotein translocase subunit SecF